MKYFSVLCCVIVLFTISMHAQVTYPFPQRVQVGTLSPGIPNSERDPVENPAAAMSPYIENFNPIGWSSDGKAAFLRWGEVQNGSYFGVVIYDVIKDTIAGEWFENMSGMADLDAVQVPAYWKRDMDSIQPLLKKFGINSAPVQQIFFFPFTLKNGYSYGMEFNIHESKSDPHFYTGYDGNCIVSNVSTNTTDTLHFSCDGLNAFDIQPVGIWFNPDYTHAFVINYAETNNPAAQNTIHYFNYFLTELKLK